MVVCPFVRRIFSPDATAFLTGVRLDFDPIFMHPIFVLTGGIASGKSTFARFLSEAGCETLDADDIVRRLQAPGGAASAPIRAAFGDGVFLPGGTLDRAALAGIIFRDPEARRTLEAIIHPMVREAFAAWRGKPSATPRVAVIPLLFESGWQHDWPHITCMAVSPGVQMQRLTERGLSAADAGARIRAQLPLEEKIKNAHLVIWNNGTREALRGEAAQWLKKVTT